MKPRQRCAHCGGRLGLGVISAKIYVPEKWWWIVVRFDRRSCRDLFLKKKAEELARRTAVSALFKPP